MEKLEKYTSYKNSGIEWLGEIPEHWGIKKLKHALKFTTGGTPSSGVEDYYNGEKPWITISDMTGRYIEKSHFISKKAIRECNMQIVPKDSLLYSFKLSVGQVAFTTQNTYTNEAIASFYPANNINLNFWYYVLPVYVIRNANKNIYGAYLLNQDLIKNATIIFPPKEEQTKIASFLDKKTSQLDKAISQKEKLIELLKEQKQITINKAVTKGLDKDLEFKESCIEWIGKIPKHWEVKTIKALFEERKEMNKPIKTDNILSLCMYRGVIPYGEKGSGGNKAKEDLTAYKIAYPDDIVLNSMNVIAGSVGLSKYHGIVSPVYYMLYRRNQNDSIMFYNYIFRNQSFQKSLIRLGNGILIKKSESTGKLNTIRLKIPMIKLNREVLPYPPQNEQIQIAEFVKTQTTKIDKAIELQQNYIAKLKEYKASLIDSVVTGKVRVA